MAVADELRKSFASDGATYSLGIQTRQVSSNDAEALASTITEKKLAAKPAAHRSSISAADTGDISSASGALDVGNSMQVACFVDFDDPSIQAQIALALYDAAGDLIGITDFNTFNSDSSWRDGGSGPYVSPRYIYDVSGASQVLAKVKSLTSGGVVNIFLMAL